MNDSQKIDSIKQWLGTGSVNIFGFPFAGKDTQCRILNELVGGSVIGGGDILRNSVITQESKDALKTGKLVPSKDYKDIVLPYLLKPEFDNKPLLLSSIGRWSGEEKDVILNLDKSNHPLKAVIYLKTSEEDSINRWLMRSIKNDRQSRHDDTKDLLQIRLNEFKEKTIPVINYYKNTGLLIEIDGSDSQEKVTENILTALLKNIN